MRMSVSLLLLLGCSISHSYAQGTVNFANLSTSRVTRMDGTFVTASDGIRAELVYAPDGTSPALFDSIAIRLGMDVAVGVPVAGAFNGGTRTAPTATPGGHGLFQVRAWSGWAGPDYRSALATGNPNVWYGQSAILRVDTGDPTIVPPETPRPLTGLTSFCVGPFNCIPEPSTVALGMLGAAALLLVRRRR